jgi:hypothetical protein
MSGSKPGYNDGYLDGLAKARQPLHPRNTDYLSGYFRGWDRACELDKLKLVQGELF